MKIVYITHLASIFLAWILITFYAESTIADRSTYIVHMDKSAMPMVFTTHDDWYSSTLGSLEVNNTITSDTLIPKPILLYTYDNAFHGFSAVLSSTELEVLQNSPWFIAAYPDKIIRLHTTRTIELLSPIELLSLNTETGLWPASELGKGVIIGLMDTGVWPESKSYCDDGMAEIPTRWKGVCQAGENFNSSMCNKKLIGARYYNRGTKAANSSGETVEGTPRDNHGHGTHTSTTAAGNFVQDISFFGYAKGTARGVAPRAHVAMYQVNVNSGTDSDFIAGMDQAIADGVDVISISMGTGWTPYYEDSIAITTFAAMEKGVFVSASAGNTGPGPGMVENGVPWLLTVGASTIDRQNSAVVTLGNGVSISGWSEYPVSLLLEGIPLIYNKTLLGCTSPETLLEASGKIIICSEEYGTSTEQVQAVIDSNVAGAIFISNDTRYMEIKDMECPGVVINPASASQLISYASSTSNPTSTMKFQQEILGAKPAPAVAYYSSRGPSKVNPTILKPDLIAPGTKVLAAWVPTITSTFLGPHMLLSSDYNFNSGTSMACPHAAGVAALLKGAHPEWSPAAIRSAMMTTASQIGNDGSPIRDNGLNLTYATPLEAGAGQIDPNKALDPGLIYDADAQDYVIHLCSLNFTREQIMVVTRLSKYNCTSSSELNYPSFMAYVEQGSSNIYEFRRTVTNIGNDEAKYEANLVVPCGTSVSVTPETLHFSDKYQKLGFTISVDITQMKDVMVYGSLVWKQVGGNHTVRSPIMVLRKV